MQGNQTDWTPAVTAALGKALSEEVQVLDLVLRSGTTGTPHGFIRSIRKDNEGDEHMVHNVFLDADGTWQFRDGDYSRDAEETDELFRDQVCGAFQ